MLAASGVVDLAATVSVVRTGRADRGRSRSVRPRRNRIREGPDSDLFRLRHDLGGCKNGIVRVLFVVPGQSCLDECQRDVRSIHDDAGDQTSVPVSLLALDPDLLAEDKVGCELLGPVGEVRTGLRTVDAIEPDSCLLTAVVDRDGIDASDPQLRGRSRPFRWWGFFRKTPLPS